MNARMLIRCGAISAGLYAAMNVIAPLAYPGYDPVAQTVSELSAIGAPTRAFWVLTAFVYSLLALAFGWGVWRTAGDKEPLRITGALLIANSVLGFFWPPMHQRAVLGAGGGTATDTLHLVFSAVTVTLFFLIVGFGAGAFGRRFQRYSIVTMLLMFGFGGLVAIAGPRVGANLPTPWVGVWERLDIGVYLAWVVSLSVTLLRTLPSTGTEDHRERAAGASTRAAGPTTPAPVP